MIHTEGIGGNNDLRSIDVEVHLGMFSSDSLGLSHGYVTDQLADVLHVVNVLGEEVALNLQPVGVGGEAGRWEKFNNLVFLKLSLA